MRRSPFRSINPHRLYRNPERGVIAGVCAGIADYFGISVTLTRVVLVAVVLFTMVTLPFAALAYILAWIFLPQRPSELDAMEPPDRDFWRSMATQPTITVSAVSARFHDLDRRVGDVEKHVTSEEYRLDKEFRDLEGRR